jgi:hypothetical protein
MPTCAATAVLTGALTAGSSRFVPGGSGTPSVAYAFAAVVVMRVPMPNNMRDDVVFSAENARPKPIATEPLPSSRGTLNVAPSVLMSRLPISPSSTALKLFVM